MVVTRWFILRENDDLFLDDHSNNNNNKDNKGMIIFILCNKRFGRLQGWDRNVFVKRLVNVKPGIELKDEQ